MVASDRKSRLVFGILEFLDQSISDGTIRADDKESMEVAMQCISESFHVDYPGDRSMSMKPATLLSVFDVYAKTADQQQHASGTATMTDSASAPAAASSSSTAPGADTATTAWSPPTQVATASEKAQADAAKTEGNQLMSAKRYEEAIEKYSLAISQDGLNPVYYSNRAAAYSQVGDHMKAIEDAHKAIRVDDRFAKAYSRLGHAYYSSDMFSEAVDAYEKGLQLEPNNSVMKTSLGMAKAKLTRDATMREGTNDDDSDDIMNAARAAAGGGGLGGLASMMNNPTIQNFMQTMSQNGGLEALLQDPSIRQMADQMQRGGSMPDMASIMSNPTLRNLASSLVGSAGAGAGTGDAAGDVGRGRA